MEKTGCKITCGAPTTLAVRGLMMMMMMSVMVVANKKKVIFQKKHNADNNRRTVLLKDAQNIQDEKYGGIRQTCFRDIVCNVMQ